jgi:hypothetical protein
MPAYEKSVSSLKNANVSRKTETAYIATYNLEDESKLSERQGIIYRIFFGHSQFVRS